MKLVIASLLLSGLNFGIMISNCSLLVIESYMNVQNPQNYIISLLSTSSLIGMTVGSLAGSVLSTKFGLRRILIITSSLSILFGVVQCIYVQWWFLLMCRIFQGFCVGVITIIVQPWDLQLISEQKKKIAAGVFSICVTTGCTISSIMLFLMIPNRGLWVFSFAITAAISLTLVIIQTRLPHKITSPNQNSEKLASVDYQTNLLTSDSETSTTKTTSKKWSTQPKQYQFAPIVEQLESQTTIKKHKRIMFAFAACMGASQQIVGINTVLIYASLILENLFSKSDSLTKSISSLILSFTNLIFNIIAAFIVPRVNKKIMFIIAYILTSLCLLIIGIIYTIMQNKQVSSQDNYIVLIVLIMYLLFYQLGPGCSYFVIISEAYPSQHLTTYTGISYSFNWMFNIISVIVYPLIGTPTFFIYFGVAICIIIAIIFIFPKPKQSGYNNLLNLDRV